MYNLIIFKDPFNPSRNQPPPQSAQSNVPPSLSDALNRVLNNLFAGAHTAVKNLISKNLPIDSMMLRSSNNHVGGRDFIEIALEKIVDKLNFQFYKAHSNATYDPIREHVDYFRLPLNDKMAVLMENVYNSTIGALTTLDHRLSHGFI